MSFAAVCWMVMVFTPHTLALSFWMLNIFWSFLAVGLVFSRLTVTVPLLPQRNVCITLPSAPTVIRFLSSV